MNRVKKIYLFIKYWGLKYGCMRFYDRFHNTEEASQFMYEYQAKLPQSEYKNELIKLFHIKTGKKLDLENPISFNEKIQWLKLYNTTPLKTKLSDKFLVREWVEQKIGEEYLIPLLGVYSSAKDINLQALPEKFVLKTNHGSGCNIIVRNKNDLNWDEIEKTLDEWMAINFAWRQGLELQYKDIKPLIIAEEFIENKENNLRDYKIHCFNGEPKFIQLIGDRDIVKHTGKEAFYSLEWELQNFTYTYPKYETECAKPQNLKEMIKLAKILAEEFIYVRVDFYQLDNGVIKFGEMTFTPASGYDFWNPTETDIILGQLMQLPI